jgi:hypothetical protein
LGATHFGQPQLSRSPLSTTVATLQSRIATLLGQSVGDESFDTVSLLNDINQAWRFDLIDLTVESRRSIIFSYGSIAAGPFSKDINSKQPETNLYAAIVGDTARWAKFSLVTPSFPLIVFTSRTEFWSNYDPVSIVQGTPESVLIEGTVFTVRPDPSFGMYIYLDVIPYNTPLIQSDTIGSIYDFEMQAVLYLSALNAANRIGDSDSVVRVEKLAMAAVDSLRSRAFRATHRHVRVGRNF